MVAILIILIDTKTIITYKYTNTALMIGFLPKLLQSCVRMVGIDWQSTVEALKSKK
jgi:hypothetical protein